MNAMNYAASMLSVLLITSVVSGIFSSARSANVEVLGATEVFDVKPVLKVFLVIGAIGFAVASFVTLLIPPISWLGASIFAFFSLCAVVGFPNPIVLTVEKIEEVKWWGRKTTIKWTDVTKVEFRKGPSITVVFSRDGQSIAHSGLHAASEQFRDECARRSHHVIVSKNF